MNDNSVQRYSGGNMLRAIGLACLVLVSGCAGGPPDPNAVSAADLKKLISGHTVRIGSARGVYREDGTYTYNGGSPGRYRVSDGMLCIDFDDNRSRCDRIVRSGNGFDMITGSGDRVPFKPI